VLVLLRHGKSAYPPGVPDHDRPLAGRGERQAALAGEWIGEHVAPVDQVLCSTATRARQTLERAGLNASVRYSSVIYGAEPDELITVLREDLTGPERTVLVVGHFPGLPYLAADLAGSGSDSDALDRLYAGFPTSAVAVLEVSGQWVDIGPGRCTLRDYVIPR